MTAHILVVDDEPDVEALVLQKFRPKIRGGAISFLFARDGVEALAALKANGQIDLDHAARAVACALALDEYAQAFRARCHKKGVALGVTRIGVMPDRRSSAILVAGASSTTQPMATPSTLRRDWKLPTSNSVRAYAPAQPSRPGWKSSEADRSGTLF
jgi:hypothetical protein